MCSDIGDSHTIFYREKEAESMHVKHVRIDEAELLAMHQDESFFLVKSVANYIHCLRLGDEYILPVFRLISLWFQNSSQSAVNKLIQVCLRPFFISGCHKLVFFTSALFAERSRSNHFVQVSAPDESTQRQDKPRKFPVGIPVRSSERNALSSNS